VSPLVVGCGNTSRGDDAAGLVAARLLRERGWSAIGHEGDGLQLLDLWAGRRHVILVDAVTDGRPDGSVAWWDARAAPLAEELFRGSTHHFGVAAAMRLGGALGRLPERLELCGISASRFEPGSAPSPAVLAGARRAAARIEEVLRECTNRR
jgi:hydrogenase maturation protease